MKTISGKACHALAATCALCLAHEVSAADEAKISDLAPPEVVATALLGQASTEIPRIESLADLGLQLDGVLNGGGDSASPMIGFEVAPYWALGGGKDVSFESYVEPDGLWNTIQYSTRVSIARQEFTRTLGETEVKGDSYAVGITMLLKKRPMGKTLKERIESYRAPMGALNLDRGVKIDSIENNEKLTDEEKAALIEALNANYVANAPDGLRQGVEDALHHRPGVDVSLSAGVVLDDFEDASRPDTRSKTAVWLTAAYSPDTTVFNSDTECLAIVRSVWDDTTETEIRSTDCGIRLVLTPLKGSISLSAEYLKRFTDGDDRERYSAIATYRFNKSTAVLFKYTKTFDESGGSFGIGFAQGWGGARGAQ
ncbi:MAG: DUF1542 domain-containing protein [Opitutaceae bacterium]|nr:DUF1542 domain-containing protein [Opitutaceae bacterium]